MNSGNGLSRNMSSSEIAGIGPYDRNGLIIYLSLIDNFFSSFGVRRQGQEPSRGQGRNPRVARAGTLAWPGQEPSRGQGRSPRAARAEALARQDAVF